MSSVDTLNQAVQTATQAGVSQVAQTVQPDHNAAAEHKPQLLGYDPGVAIFTLITFGVLLLVLKKYAWGPILNGITNRESYIRDSLERADKAQKEASVAEDARKQLLSEARAEGDRIRSDIESTAMAKKAQIEQAALEERNRILAEAERVIAQEKEKAQRELRESVVQLTMEATRKLIGENLDEQRSKALIDQHIQKI